MPPQLRAILDDRAAPENQASGDNQNERKRLPKTTLRERLVLFAISDREIHGLGIQKIIEDCSQGREKISIGSLYPTLHKLEQKGLVVSCFGDTPPAERCGAKRRYYKSTEKGKAVIQEILDFQNDLLSWKS